MIPAFVVVNDQPVVVKYSCLRNVASFARFIVEIRVCATGPAGKEKDG